MKKVIILTLICVMQLSAQLTPWQPWTFLDAKLMDEIIGEVSGETAINHMYELGAYNRNRPLAEYKGDFLEAAYVLKKLKEYGLEGAKIDRFKGGETWDVEMGELWEMKPNRSKLADYDDVPASLAGNSESVDLKAELIWVGEGRAEDFKGINVKGKIVVSYSSGRALLREADKHGAVGGVSIYSPRPTFDPTQILWSSITPGKNAKFLFYMPPKSGLPLKARLVRGEKITVHAQIKTQKVEYEIQDPTAFIRGTDKDADEVILTAHLFEGYAKQGANDNISGSAKILEVARAMNHLINTGKLERPKRTIRFLWIPEFSGSIPWVKANPELMDKTLCNINTDMVGAKLSMNHSFYSVMRTTFGNPHYVNDVMENYLRYVGRTNREVLQNRRYAKNLKPIMAPTGSIEPFRWSIETHYGSSDHEVFNAIGVRVPGVLMITWPDQFYHTSQDRVDKADPTQLKRAAVISLAAAYTIANADDKMAAKIAGEVTSNSSRRLGHLLARGLDELNRADKDNFADRYKRARGYFKAGEINEHETIDATLELVSNESSAKSQNKMLKQSVTEIAQGLIKAFDNQANIIAMQNGFNKVSSSMSSEDKKASTTIPKATEKLKTFSRSFRNEMKDEIKDYPSNARHWNEINLLIDGKHSVLEIKQMLDVQYEDEAKISEIYNHLKVLKAAGMVL